MHRLLVGVIKRIVYSLVGGIEHKLRSMCRRVVANHGIGPLYHMYLAVTRVDILGVKLQCYGRLRLCIPFHLDASGLAAAGCYLVVGAGALDKSRHAADNLVPSDICQASVYTARR